MSFALIFVLFVRFIQHGKTDEQLFHWFKDIIFWLWFNVVSINYPYYYFNFFLTEMPVISKSVYFFFEIYNLIQNYILLCFVIFISHTRELFYMFHLSLQWQPQTGNFLWCGTFIWCQIVVLTNNDIFDI